MPKNSFFYLKMFKLYIEIINTMKNVFIFPVASTIPIHNQGNTTQLMPLPFRINFNQIIMYIFNIYIHKAIKFNVQFSYSFTQIIEIEIILKHYLRGVQAVRFRKHDPNLSVGGDGPGTHQQLEVGFASVRATLPM